MTSKSSRYKQSGGSRASARLLAWRWFRFFLTFVSGLLLTYILALLSTDEVVSGGFQKTIENLLSKSPTTEIFVLALFGWFGGLIYSFAIDGTWELPTAGGKLANIRPGFLGDVLMGVAGAFVAYAFVPSNFYTIQEVTNQTLENGDVVSQVLGSPEPSFIRLAVVGIIGGYGAKLILNAAVDRFVKHVDESVLDEERVVVVPQASPDPGQDGAAAPMVPASGLDGSPGSTTTSPTPGAATAAVTAQPTRPLRARAAAPHSIAIRPDRWDVALSKAPSVGASARTASQDGLKAGIAASEKMAQTDLQRVLKFAPQLEAVAVKYDFPPAVLAAIASRESRAGQALDNGYGDHGNAFGIMQVDFRYHNVAGVNEGPGSQPHIDQATNILSQYRQEVSQKHPGWEPEYVLKGAIVAYNSGPGNVQTKAGLDKGTTGNDYGSDTLARARFYAKNKHFRSLAECKAGVSSSASIATANVIVVQDALDVLDDVTEAILFPSWSAELKTAVEAALIHAGFLKVSGDPKKLKAAWAKFKTTNNQTNPDSIGEGSARLLMDALGKPHEASEEHSPTGEETVNQNAGSRTGRPKTLPTGELVYENEYILPNIPLTWGECTKGMSRWPTRKAEVENARKLAKAFGEVRRQYGKPLIITSGFRPEPVNSQVGGVSGSKHVSFMALDIHPTDGDFRRLLQILRSVSSIGAIGLGQQRGFLHMDIRKRINGKQQEWPY